MLTASILFLDSKKERNSISDERWKKIKREREREEKKKTLDEKELKNIQGVF